MLELSFEVFELSSLDVFVFELEFSFAPLASILEAIIVVLLYFNSILSPASNDDTVTVFPFRLIFVVLSTMIVTVAPPFFGVMVIEFPDTEAIMPFNSNTFLEEEEPP